MDVGMKQEILAPGVQDGEESDLGSKMFGIGGHLGQCLGNSAEQQVIEFNGVLPDERVEFMGQREYDVKVAGRQQFLLSRSDPSLTRLSLTLGTMTVTAGVERDAVFIVAPIPTCRLHTLVDVTAQSGGAATRNGEHDLQLLKSEPVSMVVDEVVTMRAKNVGHLDGGPGHSFFFLPDRLMVSSVETGIASTGFVTECRCRSDRCK
jgi:hypothetical protein